MVLNDVSDENSILLLTNLSKSTLKILFALI